MRRFSHFDKWTVSTLNKFENKIKMFSREKSFHLLSAPNSIFSRACIAQWSIDSLFAAIIQFLLPIFSFMMLKLSYDWTLATI